MTSSSIILSDILASESCELKTTIDSYIDTKLREFQEIMKSKVDSIITDKIDKFYNKSFEDHDKVLFDSNGLDIINQYYIKPNQTTYIELEQRRKEKESILKAKNTKCFIKSYEIQNRGRRYVHVFKTFFLCQDQYPLQSPTHPIMYKHNLSSDCLFAIKYFNFNNNEFNIYNSLSLLENHPEYFKKNCSDFEEICRKEYSEIKETKSQLKALMDEHITKKDYYASLEEKIKDIEIEKTQLEKDRIKLEEEKKKMVFIKEKLVQMKEEVKIEKQEIEQQKNKTFDLDKCFEEIISKEELKHIQKDVLKKIYKII